MITFQPIGFIKTPFQKPENMPVQSIAGQDIKGEIEILPEFVEGLKDLDMFSHLILIYHLHQAKKHKLHVIPFLDDKPHGIFATRSPNRPNALGFSIVRLIDIKNNIIHIQDIDMLNNTPLIDIKPYLSKFDHRENVKNGWLPENIKMENQKSDTRFIK